MKLSEEGKSLARTILEEGANNRRPWGKGTKESFDRQRRKSNEAEVSFVSRLVSV